MDAATISNLGKFALFALFVWFVLDQLPLWERQGEGNFNDKTTKNRQFDIDKGATWGWQGRDGDYMLQAGSACPRTTLVRLMPLSRRMQRGYLTRKHEPLYLLWVIPERCLARGIDGNMDWRPREIPWQTVKQRRPTLISGPGALYQHSNRYPSLRDACLLGITGTDRGKP